MKNKEGQNNLSPLMNLVVESGVVVLLSVELSNVSPFLLQTAVPLLWCSFLQIAGPYKDGSGIREREREERGEEKRREKRNP